MEWSWGGWEGRSGGSLKSSTAVGRSYVCIVYTVCMCAYVTDREGTKREKERNVISIHEGTS